MASQGPLSPGTLANDAAVGTVAWTTPGNAAASDDARAECAFSAAAGTTSSNYLKATNFGFTIPTGATIDGIVVEIERHANGTTCRDVNVKIVKADATIGATNKADTANDWPTTDTYKTYGGATDLWGETWTPADINDVDFGVVLSGSESSAFARTLRVDHIRITVHYTGGGSAVGVTRAVAYDVINTVGATRTVAYDVLNVVGRTRAVAYDVLNAAALARAVVYDVGGIAGLTRAVAYDVLNPVGRTRDVAYDVLTTVGVTRLVVYDLLVAPPPPLPSHFAALGPELLLEIDFATEPARKSYRLLVLGDRPRRYFRLAESAGTVVRTEVF